MLYIAQQLAREFDDHTRGPIPTPSQRAAAERDACYVCGVRDVRDRLEVRA
jgi:hypothetical protein